MDGDIFSFCLDEISEKIESRINYGGFLLDRMKENIRELYSKIELTQSMSTDTILETFVKQYRYRR